MIRTESGCGVWRFAGLVGVPGRTCHNRVSRLRAGVAPKGRWPAWGYRKIAAIAAGEGCDVGSASSVKRAMARRGSAGTGQIPARAPPARAGTA